MSVDDEARLEARLREWEDKAIPHAEARRMVAGLEPTFEDAEEAREYLALIEMAERAHKRIRALDEEERQEKRSPKTLALRHAAKASELESIARRSELDAEKHAHRAAGIIVGREEAALSDDDYARYRKAARASVEEAELSRRAKRQAKAERKAQEKIRVQHEPGPYETRSSPHSWVRDVLVSAEPSLRGLVDRSTTSKMDPEAVAERLSRHARDVGGALLTRSKYGKRIEALLREGRRQEDATIHERRYREEVSALRSAEFRALTTGGGATASAAGGGFAALVPPAILMDSWARYRSPYRAFADQLDSSVPLPEFGLEAYVPIVSTGTTVSTQTEGSGVSEGDPVTGFASGAIVNKAGQITVTQQFLDRAGPGIAGDVVLYRQLHEQLDAQIDAYAIAQALAGAQAVTNAGTFAVASASGVGGFMKDLKSAKNLLHDAAGVRLRGTHAFAIGDFCDYLSAYADAQGRPLFTPTLDDNRLPIRSVGDQAAEGYTGYVLVGLALFADDNIPNASSNAQIIVCRPDTILLLEGEPVPYCYPPSVAGSLEAVLGVRCYTTTIPRFPTGIASISGAAYLASQFA